MVNTERLLIDESKVVLIRSESNFVSSDEVPLSQEMNNKAVIGEESRQLHRQHADPSCNKPANADADDGGDDNDNAGDVYIPPLLDDNYSPYSNNSKFAPPPLLLPALLFLNIKQHILFYLLFTK